MLKILPLLTLLSLTVTNAQAPSILWQQALNGSQEDQGNSVAQTLDGGFIGVGTSSSTNGGFSTNHGGYDAAVIKYDADGEIVWQKMFGGTGYDILHNVAATADGGCVAIGSTTSNNGDISGNHGSSDVWILKLDALGGIQWQRVMGSTSSDQGCTIRQTPDGKYLVGAFLGGLNGDSPVSSGFPMNAWVLRLNSAGQTIWQQIAPNNIFNPTQGTRVVHSPDGGCLMVYTNSSPNGIQEGSTTVYYTDIRAIKYSASGAQEWARWYGGSYGEEAGSVQSTADGGYIITGRSMSNDGDVTGHHGTPTTSGSGNDDIWVLKVSASGDIQWQKSLGGDFNDNAADGRQTADGGYVIVGTTASYNGDVIGNHGNWTSGMADFWIVKLNPIGSIQWSRCIGGTGAEVAMELDLTTDQGFAIMGRSTSNNGDCTAAYGLNDMWLVKLGPETLDVNGSKTPDFALYPNPAFDSFSIQAREPILELLIYDLAGKCIQSFMQPSPNINVSGLTAGMYIVKIRTAHGISNASLLKQ